MTNPTTSAPSILVTGGAGYIGSHAVLALEQAGYQVVILDSLEYGHQDLVEQHLNATLIKGNTTDRDLLDQLFTQYDFVAVMHFAAYIAVGESVTAPADYYRNNVYGTLNLLQAMQVAGIKQFVFSSTCAIYGPPKTVPIPEDHPKNPISPYASSKLMVEMMLKDFQKAYGLQSVCFRYFNAAGADPQGRLGEDHNPETHLIPLVLQTALGTRDHISIYGTDYTTRDGTCIRDYIHVADLADAHVKGVQYLIDGGETAFINLGNGNGFTVKEVIETARKVTGHPIPALECGRRPGDPPSLIGSSEHARQRLKWTPQYADLETIISHAWQWHQKRHG
ncbi:UDP-glucose 4-epimerase GalE [Leptothoe spongobia]|uniref:UDP-glucose 4-epimerase n=1 Tax=Leptothoe spongobia TAU-MAC 1115 TaxID=1967444 RepID=A0A947GHW4_9CYAN|nr:UDP-glucose 4-epimerase GalE [Leptothoe spongobia]MBT9315249.1 UDP-glucose 4-epimerase GalE [Leptothoe spongobia TAU-MAC 1115]